MHDNDLCCVRNDMHDNDLDWTRDDMHDKTLCYARDDMNDMHDMAAPKAVTYSGCSGTMKFNP